MIYYSGNDHFSITVFIFTEKLLKSWQYKYWLRISSVSMLTDINPNPSDKPSTLCNRGIWEEKAPHSPCLSLLGRVHISFMATGVTCCHKMGLEGKEQIIEQAPAPVNMLSPPRGN